MKQAPAGNRIQGELLASGMQQIKRFLVQRGGANSDTVEQKLAHGVNECVFTEHIRKRRLSLRNSEELRILEECVDALRQKRDFQLQGREEWLQLLGLRRRLLCW